MNDKLLKEEQLVVDCLSRYYCLKWEQLIQLLYYKDEEVASRILVGLKKRQLILVDEANYVTLDPRSTPDPKTIAAFWVLLKFIQKINHKEHYRAEYPSDIFFLKENVQYEIVSIYPGEEHLIGMLKGYNRINSDDELDEIRYIFIVQNEDQIDECLKKTEGMTVLFAMVTPNETEIPDVSFFKV